MAARIASLLQIREGEGRMALHVVLLFALIGAGRGVGRNANDALFITGFGVEFLPYMFILLGAVSFVVSLAYSTALSRVKKQLLFTIILGGFAVLLIVERLALALDARALYPVLYTTINIASGLLATLVWVVAGEVADARQAKRLFPLFASAQVLGRFVGNLATPFFENLIGTESLIGLYAVMLVLGLMVTRPIVRNYFVRKPVSSRRRSFMSDLRIGYDVIRTSPLLRLLAWATVLNSILFYAFGFLFNEAVANTDLGGEDVASFFGYFYSVVTIATFFVSLFIANRLYAAIGLVNAFLFMGVAYIVGFILLLFNPTLTGAAIARFLQLVVTGGIAGTAFNSFFNVVPNDRRSQTRTYNSAVPEQIGVMLSGALILVGQRFMQPAQVFVLGLGVSVVYLALCWRMRKGYAEALVNALKAGQVEVFDDDETATLGFQDKTAAQQAALKAIGDDQSATRRMAIEMLAAMKTGAAIPALMDSLRDPEPEIRIAAVRALGALKAFKAVEGMQALLATDRTEVRAVVIETLAEMGVEPNDTIARTIEMLLSGEDLEYRLMAIRALALYKQGQLAWGGIVALLEDPDPERRARGVHALADIIATQQSIAPDTLGDHYFETQPLLDMLEDESYLVRQAACIALDVVDDPAAIEPLVRRLSDEDLKVRRAAARALKTFGLQANPVILPVLEVEDDPVELAALEALTPGDERLHAPLHTYAFREIGQLRDWNDKADTLTDRGPASAMLLGDLQSRANFAEQRLVKTLGLLGQADALDIVGDSLRDMDSRVRAAAIETLETIGDDHIVKELIPLLEDDFSTDLLKTTARMLSAWKTLQDLTTNEDVWLRALAARSAVELGLPKLKPAIETLRDGDTDPMVQEAARDALILFEGGNLMQTLSTISVLDRVILLRELPLFASLPLEDLRRVADVAYERTYLTGEFIFEEGDEGDEMFVIASGMVHVARGGKDQSQVINTLKAGNFLGEMAVIEAVPRSASVQAAGEVRMLIIEGKAFRIILRERPDVALAVIRELSRRLRHTSTV